MLGPGKDQHLFYNDAAVKAAYKKYISTMLSRNNTITNITYSADPTIMAGMFGKKKSSCARCWKHVLWIALFAEDV